MNQDLFVIERLPRILVKPQRIVLKQKRTNKVPHFGHLDFYREFLAIIPAEEGTKDVAIACPGVEFSVMELVEELDCQLYGRRKLVQGCLVS